jgi:hypothetical protein
MILRVQCYGGWKADERPMRFGEREVFDSGRAGQKPKDGSPAYVLGAEE